MNAQRLSFVLLLLTLSTAGPRAAGPEPTPASVDEPSLQAMRDITPIEQLPPVERPPVALIVAIGATVLLLGILLRILLRRKPTTQPERSHAEAALHELDRIDALDLPTEREIERFHVLVSDVLRQYVERRFGRTATGQTSAEFLDGLRRSTVLTSDQQAALHDFLGQCDLAKFARATFTPFECQALSRTARAFIQQTQPSPLAGRASDGFAARTDKRP